MTQRTERYYVMGTLEWHCFRFLHDIRNDYIGYLLAFGIITAVGGVALLFGGSISQEIYRIVVSREAIGGLLVIISIFQIRLWSKFRKRYLDLFYSDQYVPLLDEMSKRLPVFSKIMEEAEQERMNKALKLKGAKQ